MNIDFVVTRYSQSSLLELTVIDINKQTSSMVLYDVPYYRPLRRLLHLPHHLALLISAFSMGCWIMEHGCHGCSAWETIGITLSLVVNQPSQSIQAKYSYSKPTTCIDCTVYSIAHARGFIVPCFVLFTLQFLWWGRCLCLYPSVSLHWHWGKGES